MKAEHYSKAVRTTVGLAALSLLAGCANGPGWGAWSQRPSNAEMAAVIERTDPVEAPPEPAPLAPPRRPLSTEVTFGNDR